MSDICLCQEAAEEIESLRQRLAISEAEGLEQARLLGMSGEREAALLAEIDAVAKQRDELLAAMAKVADILEADRQGIQVKRCHEDAL